MPFKVEREEFVNKTFRIPKPVIDKMSEICNQKNVSLNKLVIMCIEYALNDMESK